MIEDLIYNVLNTLRKFELGFTSVKRNPIDYQIRVQSLEEFIECRLNFEAFKVSELLRAVELLDGYLFKVTHVEGVRRNRFNKIRIELSTSCPEGVSQDEFDEIINDVENFIGGRSLSFSSNKNNMELIIE